MINENEYFTNNIRISKSIGPGLYDSYIDRLEKVLKAAKKCVEVAEEGLLTGPAYATTTDYESFREFQENTGSFREVRIEIKDLIKLMDFHGTARYGSDFKDPPKRRKRKRRRTAN